MRSALSLFVLIVCLMAVLLVAGCERKITYTGPSAVSYLRRQWWYLQGLGAVGQEVPLVQETRIRAKFRDDSIIEGSSGCNGYWGHYQVPDENRLAISVEAVTDAVCGTPVGVMEQEIRYIEALQRVFSFEVKDDILRLYYAEGDSNLYFSRVESLD